MMDKTLIYLILAALSGCGALLAFIMRASIKVLNTNFTDAPISPADKKTDISKIAAINTEEFNLNSQQTAIADQIMSQLNAGAEDQEHAKLVSTTDRALGTGLESDLKSADLDETDLETPAEQQETLDDLKSLLEIQPDNSQLHLLLLEKYAQQHDFEAFDGALQKLFALGDLQANEQAKHLVEAFSHEYAQKNELKSTTNAAVVFQSPIDTGTTGPALNLAQQAEDDLVLGAKPNTQTEDSSDDAFAALEEELEMSSFLVKAKSNPTLDEQAALMAGTDERTQEPLSSSKASLAETRVDREFSPQDDDLVLMKDKANGGVILTPTIAEESATRISNTIDFVLPPSAAPISTIAPVNTVEEQEITAKPHITVSGNTVSMTPDHHAPNVDASQNDTISVVQRKQPVITISSNQVLPSAMAQSEQAIKAQISTTSVAPTVMSEVKLAPVQNPTFSAVHALLADFPELSSNNADDVSISLAKHYAELGDTANAKHLLDEVSAEKRADALVNMTKSS